MGDYYGAYERNLYNNPPYATLAEGWEDDEPYNYPIKTNCITHPYNTRSSHSRLEYLPDADALDAVRKRIAEREYAENHTNPNEEKPLCLPIAVPVAIPTSAPRPIFERKQHYKTALEPDFIATFEKFGKFVNDKCATNNKFEDAETDEHLILLKRTLLKRNEELDEYYNNEDYKEQVATMFADMESYRVRSKKRFADLGINHTIPPLATQEATVNSVEV